MKRIFFLFIVLAMTLAAKAQDVIVTKTAERIDAIIEEVSETQIKYKKANNPTGPTFVLGTDKIATIIYSNGSVQTFSQSQPQTPPQPAGTVSLRELARAQELQERQDDTPTPEQGPWLLWGLQVKEGWNMYLASKTEYTNSAFGIRFLPGIEGYVEYAPKQDNMDNCRRAAYLGLQYAFRGGEMTSGVEYRHTLDLQYLCFRPAFSVEHKVFYSRTGLEMGILTKAEQVYDNGMPNNNVYEACNKATFGVWQEIGWYIKDHFNIGMTFNYVFTNSTAKLWTYKGMIDYHYSPQLELQLVLGWRFNPYKIDKKKVEKIRLETNQL